MIDSGVIILLMSELLDNVEQLYGRFEGLLKEEICI